MSKWKSVIALALLAATSAMADTVVLSSGATMDGVVSYPNANAVAVTVGDERMLFGKSEVIRVEQNDRRGDASQPLLSPYAKNHDDAVQQRTGLNAAQRQRILDLIEPLKSEDPVLAREAREALVAEGRRMNIVPFIEYTLDSLSPLFLAQVLRVLVELEPAKGREKALGFTHAIVPETRAAALDALAALKDSEAFSLNLRGAIDQAALVQIAAMKNLVTLGDRRATPTLLFVLETSTDERVKNVASSTLDTLWARVDGEPLDSAAWKTLWAEKGKPFSSAPRPESLEPLTDPANLATHQFESE